MYIRPVGVSFTAPARRPIRNQAPTFRGYNAGLQPLVQHTLNNLKTVEQSYLKSGEPEKAKTVAQFMTLLSADKLEQFNAEQVRDKETFGLWTEPHRDGQRLYNFNSAAQSLSQLASKFIGMEQREKAKSVLEFAILLSEDGIGIKSGNLGNLHFFMAKVHSDHEDIPNTRNSLLKAKLAFKKQIDHNPELVRAIDELLVQVMEISKDTDADFGNNQE